jgi:hypothetical protein
MSNTSPSAENSNQQEPKDLLVQQIEYLKKLVDDVDRRREIIENKTGQIFGQASIVLSIVALFIPLIPDQLQDISFYQKLVILLFFFLTTACFLRAIWLSSNTLLIDKSNFANTSTSTTTKQNRTRSVDAFLKEYKSDLIYIANKNNELINQKGTTLIKAGKIFRIGLLLLAIFIAIISIAISLKKEEPSKVQITNLDSLIKKLEHPKMLQKKLSADTNKIHSDSLNLSKQKISEIKTK